VHDRQRRNMQRHLCHQYGALTYDKNHEKTSRYRMKKSRLWKNIPAYVVIYACCEFTLPQFYTQLCRQGDFFRVLVDQEYCS
jgi:hypothetical protein